MIEVRHAGFRDLLEINDQAGLVLRCREIGERLYKVVAGCRVRQHVRHVFYGPVFSVVVVDHGHDRELEAGGLHRLHPGVEFRVGINLQVTIRPSGVQRVRNQQVDVVIVQLQRGQAGGIVFFIKRGAQRIVVLRNFTQRGDFAFAAASRLGFQKRKVRADGMEACMRVSL